MEKSHLHCNCQVTDIQRQVANPLTNSSAGTHLQGWPQSTTKSLWSWRSTRPGVHLSKVLWRSLGQTQTLEIPLLPRHLSFFPSSWTTWKSVGQRTLTSIGDPSTSPAPFATFISQCTPTWRSSRRTPPTSSPRLSWRSWSTRPGSWTVLLPRALVRPNFGLGLKEIFWKSWKGLIRLTSTCLGTTRRSTLTASI